MKVDELGIFLITYNRADFLDYTLNELLNSPFSKSRITILDNCSTDDTEKVCKKYGDIYTNVEVVRHNKNIGAGANVLRSVEISNSAYSWILCDDDVYDFYNCSDIIETMINKRADLIFVGSWEKLPFKSEQYTTCKDLYDETGNFFSTVLYLPAVIFKTDLFDASCLRSGYRNIFNHYPHFGFYLKCLNTNVPLYIAKNQILYTADDGVHGFTKLDLTISHINLAHDVGDKSIRGKYIDEAIFHNEGVSLLLGRVIATKANYKTPLVFHKNVVYPLFIFEKILTVNFLSIKHKFWFLISTLGYFLPRFFCVFLFEMAKKKIAAKYDKNLPSHIIKLRRERGGWVGESNIDEEQIDRMFNT